MQLQYLSVFSRGGAEEGSSRRDAERWRSVSWQGFRIGLRTRPNKPLHADLVAAAWLLRDGRASAPPPPAAQPHRWMSGYVKISQRSRGTKNN